MSTIVDMTLRPGDFELGRVLALSSGESAELERVVPVGGAAVPLVWVSESDDGAFAERVTANPTSARVREVERYDDRGLYALEWHPENDVVIQGLHSVGAHLVTATGTEDGWTLTARFLSREALRKFVEGGGRPTFRSASTGCPNRNTRTSDRGVG